MKNSKGKELAKNMAIFSIGSLGSKIVTFLLVPLYTYILTTEEYGYIDIINTTSSLLLPVVTLNIQDAVLRFALDNSTSKKSVFSIGLKINLLAGLVTGFVLFMLYIFNIIHWQPYMFFYLFITYYFGALYNCFSFFLRGIDKVKEVAVGGIINTLSTCLLNIILLVVIKLGIHGYLLANVLGTVVSLMYFILASKTWKYIELKNDKHLCKEMIIFSSPLILNSIAWWINNASDRYIVTLFCGVAINGIYSIAYKIPTILATVQTIFYNAWTISAVKEFDTEDRDGFIGNMYEVYSYLSTLACSGIILLNIPISKILYSRDFFEAWHYTPFLLVGILFSGLSLFQGCLFTAKKETRVITKTTICGALVNTGLNFLLIYYFGAIGASIATMIGYFTTWLFRNIALRGIIKMQVKWKKHFLACFLLIVQASIAIYGGLYLIQIAIILIQFSLYTEKLDVIIKKVFDKVRRK